MTKAILGADVGGTSSKVIVTSEDGMVLGSGKAAGGNIRSSLGDPLQNIFNAIALALDEANANSGGALELTAAHLGLAGAGPAKFAQIEADCKSRWKALGLDTETLAVSSDLDVAFAAAPHGGTGLIVLSGTGAVSAAFRDYRLVGRCDGMGWLLGDTGSSTWIGLQGIQAAARGLDYRGPATVLTSRMLDAIDRETGGPTPDPVNSVDAVQSTDPRQRLIAAVYSLAPSSYGRVSQVVFDCAEQDDPVSQGILSAAVDGLVEATAGAIADANQSDANGAASYTQAVVFAGAMLRPAGPLTESVKDALARKIPGVTRSSIHEPGAPIAGALFLAARTVSDLSLQRIQEGLDSSGVRF